MRNSAGVTMTMAMSMAALSLSDAGGVRAAEPRATIALTAVGELDRTTLEALAPVIADRFGARVEIAPPRPLPPAAHDATRRQWRASAINDQLASARRRGWERLVGVAEVDLYAPDLNFVFGEADGERGVAVFSLARLHDPDRARFLARAETEAVHELGHTYGLGHCRDRHCVMWFSNTLAETDAKGSRFCAEHAAQLARALRRTSR